MQPLLGHAGFLGTMLPFGLSDCKFSADTNASFHTARAVALVLIQTLSCT